MSAVNLIKLVCVKHILHWMGRFARLGIDHIIRKVLL